MTCFDSGHASQPHGSLIVPSADALNKFEELVDLYARFSDYFSKQTPRDVLSGAQWHHYDYPVSTLHDQLASLLAIFPKPERPQSGNDHSTRQRSKGRLESDLDRLNLNERWAY